MKLTLICQKLKSFGVPNPEQLATEFKILRSGTGSKYNNMIIEYKGARYHSLSEAYYHHLLASNPRISDIKTQVRYKLQNMDGKYTMSYIADFVVVVGENEYILDVKGRLTNENKVKLAYFTYVHQKKVILIPTSGPAKFNLDFIS